MNRSSVIAFATPVLAAALYGGARETAILAAMNLSEQPGYSWRTDVADDAHTYEVAGKTLDGYTWQRQPLPPSIARRLGRAAGAELEAFFHGASDFVIRTETGWRTLSSLPKRARDWVDPEEQYVAISVPTLGSMDVDEMGVIEPIAPPPVIWVPATNPTAPKPHSNYQFALDLPHEELAVIVSSFEQLSVNGDVASGTLSDVGARLLLVHAGHEYLEPIAATGTFMLWIKDGCVTKYRLQLAGVIAEKRKRYLVRQDSSTFVTDIGATRLPVPDDVLAALRR